MLAKFYILSVLIVCLTKVTYGADFGCDHSGVGVMKNIYHCCKHPDGHNDIADKCSIATGFKLPSAYEESILDISPENAIKGSCFSECIFNASKFINNGEVDINSIRTAIQSDHVQDQEYIREILAAFDMCHSAAEEKKAAFLKSSFVTQHLKDKCNPMPGVILSCVILKFFKNCPSTRWTNNQQCNEAKAFLDNCEKKFG